MKTVIVYLFIALSLIFILSNCKKNDELAPDKIISSKGVQGKIQKGPFISGTTVTVQELDNSFISTGRSFVSTTDNDFGGFIVEGNLKAPYIEVFASGFYYDEVKGDISSANLSLRSITETSDPTKTNVNILTTLTRERIEHLVLYGRMDYDTAKKTAQNEVLTAFDIPTDDFINFNDLDLTKEGDHNAILLAVSIVVQGNKSVAGVSELISKIVLDLKEDGELNDGPAIEELTSNARQLNLASVKANLEKRYQELSYQAIIPTFEKFAKRLVPLEVLTTNPDVGEKEVPYNLNEILIEFNKALDINTINPENIKVIDAEGKLLMGQLEYDDQDHIITFNLSQELTPNTTYQLIVNPEVKSFDGEYMEESFSMEFNSISVNIDHGLKAYYTFDGDFTDQTGNALNAKAYNIAFSSGKTDANGNQAALFSGQGSYMTLPNVINPTELNWTYSIWVRMDEKDEITGPVLLGNNMSGRQGWDVPLYFRASSQQFSSYNGHILAADYDVKLKEWYHLIIIIENGLQKMYINGELITDEDYYRAYSEDGDRSYPGFNGEDIGLYNYYDGELYICAERQTDTNWKPFLTGVIDNVRFYDRAINKFEVSELYNQGK